MPSERPSPPIVEPDGIPSELREANRWVLWNYEQVNGRWTKVPYVPGDPEVHASSTDPATWRDFITAYNNYDSGKCDGVGFVLGQGFVGVDLDFESVDGTGALTRRAREIVEPLASYTERSPSGTKVHVIAGGTLPNGRRRKGDVEMYSEARYFTVTGHHVPGTPQTVEERSQELAALHRRIFEPPNRKSAGNGSRREPQFDLDDAALLRLAQGADNGAKFSALWSGDFSAYESQSDADAALCAMLAFWTGADAARMDALFRQSGLMRDKWDERHYGDGRTYGEGTIAFAIAHCTETYSRPTTIWKRRRRPPGEREAEDGRPEIEVRDDDLVVLLAEAWDALDRANHDEPRVFRFGGVASHIGETESGEPIIRALSPEAMREELARAARWFRVKMVEATDTETGEMTKRAQRHDVKAPADLARIMVASPRESLPPLSRIIRAPLVAPSGRIVSAAGYDSETRTYYVPGGLEVPEVPERPTSEELRSALGLFAELLGDFPFVDKADKANALAMFVLPVARELVGSNPTPLHLIEKPAPGSGAGLMVEALGLLARGTAPAFLTEGRDEEEWRKRVTSTLLAGNELVVIDNVRRRLDSAALSSVLTARTWTDRRLGASENVTVPVRACWIATGNNPAMSSEIARRTVSIRIDPKQDRPWERPAEQFRHPALLKWTRANRGPLVHAALVLARGWVAEGRPSGQASLGSYEAWAETMGGILDVAGVKGFLENRARFYDRADRETETWRAFIAAWWEKFADFRVGVKELWELIEPEDKGTVEAEPPVDLGRGSNRSQKKRLGDALAQAVDRRFTIEGRTLQVEAAGTVKHAAQYRLVEIRG